MSTGSTWAEGPVWLPGERVVRWSDIPADRILEFRPRTGDPAVGETVVHRTGVEFTNGRTLDLDGRVIQCSHGRRSVEREVDGMPTTLIDRIEGRRLNSPNDVVVRSDGTIWFTDPDYGITQAAEGHPGEHEYGAQHVFRFDEASGDIRPVIVDMEQPNGLAFSPDESVLYVSDTSGVLETDGSGNRWIRAYDVLDGGTCANGRVFADTAPGVPDGLRVDENGCVWASCSSAVVVFSPAGVELARVPVPETVSNLCFGGPDGRDLYLTATTSLYHLRTSVRDATWGRTSASER